jgi:putative endonuclease
MRTARQGLGRLGEDLAARELIAHGYALVERNARTPAGEIDLVACDGPWWVFTEVRCRRGTAFGRPEDSLTARKRAHMQAAAEEYLAEHGLEDVPWRCDLVAVELTVGGQLVRVELIKNALGE